MILRCVSLLAAMLLCSIDMATAGGSVHVRAYTRKDGTYVHAYDRAAPGAGSLGGGSSAPYSASSSSSGLGRASSSVSADAPTSTKYIPAGPDPGRRDDPNWIPAKIVSGQYVAGHYKEQEPAAVAISPPAESGSPRVSQSSQPRRISRTKYSPSLYHSTRTVRQSGLTSFERSYATGLSHSPSSAFGVQRDSHGRFKRSSSAKSAFMRMTGYPHGRPGYVVDHIIALKHGGKDEPSNMQWQTVEEAKAKDKWE